MPPALKGVLDVNMKWTEERDMALSLKKGEKKQKTGTKQNMFTISCSDEHRAFLAVCDLKFFTVLAQFVAVNSSFAIENHLKSVN